LQPALARQAEVEQQQIDGIGSQYLVSRLAVVDPINGEAVPIMASSSTSSSRTVTPYRIST